MKNTIKFTSLGTPAKPAVEPIGYAEVTEAIESRRACEQAQWELDGAVFHSTLESLPSLALGR
jgi:hypothetical protein